MKDFLEQTLEDIIFSNRNIIHEKGLSRLYQNSIRQFVLPSGKKIDIFSFEIKDCVIEFSVIELKKDKGDLQTIVQAIEYYGELCEIMNSNFSIHVGKIIVVGSDIKQNPLPFLLNIPVEIYSYEYLIGGIAFKREDLEWEQPTNNKTYSRALAALHYGFIPEGENLISFYKGIKMGCPGFPQWLNCCIALDMQKDECLEYLKANNKLPLSSTDLNDLLYELN